MIMVKEGQAVETLEKRISYLRGLTDGLEIEESTREGKILSEVIQILDDMYGEMLALDARMEETESYVEAVDEDLSDLELLLYDEDDELYEVIDEDDLEEYYDLDDSEDAFVYDERRNDDEFETSYEFECPSCQEVIFLHEGKDHEGYQHYVIEPTWDDCAPVNPT